MDTQTYQYRREQLATYFDQTALGPWAKLTSDEPVGWIRATVRAGRYDMRNALLARLPADLRGRRVLDAGCGTGALAVEAASRGADVVAVDVAANLVEIARSRVPEDIGDGSIEFIVGDMGAEDLGDFDHVVAMDSLIHYDLPDILGVLQGFAKRTHRSILFTFAPRTTALAAMHFVGRLMPDRSNRAPAIAPVVPRALADSLEDDFPDGWHVAHTQRVSSGFYISQAMELRRRCDA